MTRIWRSLLKDQPNTKALPAILPVVLSQNGEVWHVPERLSDILDLPEALRPFLSPYIPDFQYHHLQLAEMDYEAITGTAAGIYALRVMKALKLDQLLSDPIWDQALIAAVPLDHFLLVMRYMLATDIDREGFKSRIIDINEAQTSTAAMTLAEQLIQEGRQEGELTLTLRQLKLKFPTIANLAEPAVRQLNEERLLAFGEALLFMTSSDDCLTWLGLK